MRPSPFSGIASAIFLCVCIALVTLSCGPLPETQNRPLPPPMPVPASPSAQESEAAPDVPPSKPGGLAPAGTGAQNGDQAPGNAAAAGNASRQQSERPSPAPLDYRDRTFRPSLHSARLQPPGQPLELPLLTLGSAQSLELLFDDLSPVVRPYRYRIVHCNRDWTPSELEDFQYLEGFDRVAINDYQYSTLALQRYIHYRAQVPAPDQRITRSGQYLLYVFDDDRPDEPVLTRRFYVTENLVGIEAEVVRPPGSQERNTHQQIRFRLLTQNLQVNNPYEQLGVHVLQNGRWDNALLDVQPQFVRNSELVYERPDQLFEAGKEWRFFSLRSLRFLSERVAEISNQTTKPSVRLFEDEVRVYQAYQYRAEMNGSWFVAMDNSDRPEVEGDYAEVAFFLDFPAPLNDGDLFLFGNMTEYRFDPEFRLTYDLDRKGYSTTQYFKQGVYNFQYAFVEKGSKEADFTVVEGNWFEAENHYDIWVYFREFNGNYDRLVGHSRIRSVR